MPKSTRFGAHRSSDSTELPNLMPFFENFRSPSFTNGTLSKFLPGTAKPCTSSPPSEDCWLCKEVNRWNSALASLSLELTEEEPGRLCLRASRDADPYPDFCATFMPCDTVFLLACLARQHACIKRLSVCGGVFECREVPTSELLKLRPGSAVECIEISGRAAHSWTAFLDTVGDVFSLRILRIEDFVVNADSTSRLVELVQANKGCLRELSFSAHDAPPEIPVELICALYRCEALTADARGYHCTGTTHAVERIYPEAISSRQYQRPTHPKCAMHWPECMLVKFGWMEVIPMVRMIVATR
ncbi:hypothetical protein HPB52_017018 [Rhipicephalus sanguineus]|uniref:Uncharacterized protein n=1 Tax=Rhipicephalus sanguineus TaxID=34632 RepID=A0A9D4T7R9_RHISA|nr:hypothetical protein HPB52_017018 [Rhipicephalus sanguineus]